MDTISISRTEKHRLHTIAFGLAILTIIIALMEGLVSTYFGYQDDCLTLFGFGAGSYIEMISGVGVAHMVVRIRQFPDSNRDNFEQTALRITGFGFYALVAGLALTSMYSIWTGHKPETTFAGIIISLASIAFMWALVFGKIKVGRQLNSDAILADAECTKVCIYMSLVLLATSGVYELTKFAYADIIGTLGLAYFSFKEGRECFEKATSNKYCSCEDVSYGQHNKI